jgi:hypothetical protein
MDRPTLIGPDAFDRPAAETPGVDRRQAFADDHVWAGRSRTEAGTWSGWHVHPGHDTKGMRSSIPPWRWWHCRFLDLIFGLQLSYRMHARMLANTPSHLPTP